MKYQTFSVPDDEVLQVTSDGRYRVEISQAKGKGKRRTYHVYYLSPCTQIVRIKRETLFASRKNESS